jgi:hypothetical protein
LTKVRLIRNDGEIIALDVTSYSMNITRSVPVLNVPVFGERYGVDMNMVSADFRLSVILADDNCTASEFEKTAASASIDFSALKGNSGGSHPVMMTGDGGSITADNLDGLFFEIETAYTGENTERKPVRVVFDSATSFNSRVNNPQTITVGIASVTTGASLANAVKTALEDNTLPPATTDQLTTDGGTNFTDAFTLTLGVGKNLSTNCKLTFTAKEKGFAGNNETPAFSTTFANKTPFFETFGGGKDRTCKSAGDKLQDLIAYVGNASLAGVSGKALGGPASPDDPNSLIEADRSLASRQTADYIVGMQLPYNSTVTSTATGTRDYTERNFIIVTGRSNADQQDSGANRLSVSTLFDPTNPFTGIAGTVVSMAFSYNAGENVYEGDLTFQPIDFIVGT